MYIGNIHDKAEEIDSFSMRLIRLNPDIPLLYMARLLELLSAFR